MRFTVIPWLVDLLLPQKLVLSFLPFSCPLEITMPLVAMRVSQQNSLSESWWTVMMLLKVVGYPLASADADRIGNLLWSWTRHFFWIWNWPRLRPTSCLTHPLTLTNAVKRNKAVLVGLVTKRHTPISYSAPKIFQMIRMSKVFSQGKLPKQ